MLYEENKTKYFAIVAIVLAVLTAGAFVYQQKTIMSLKKEILSQGEAGLKNFQNMGINSPAKVNVVRKNLENFEKELHGVIVSKSDSESSLTVKAKVINLPKLSSLTNDELNQGIETFPKIEKNYVVIIGSDTQFGSLKWPDLKEGMSLSVKSSDLIHKTDHIKALSISSVLDPNKVSQADLSIKGQIEQLKSFTGIIKEISDKFLIVSTNLVDLPKVTNFENFDARTAPKIAKEYNVLINSKTEFVGKKLNELEVGSSYRFSSPVPIYSVSEFTAAKIE